MRTGDGHVVADNVPGKVPLVISDPDVGDRLAYFPKERRPTIGVRLGARGHWVVMDLPLAEIPPEDLKLLVGVGKPVQFQLDVDGWTKVSEEYDWLLDPPPE